jgi:hypothetical protein
MASPGGSAARVRFNALQTLGLRSGPSRSTQSRARRSPAPLASRESTPQTARWWGCSPTRATVPQAASAARMAHRAMGPRRAPGRQHERQQRPVARRPPHGRRAEAGGRHEGRPRCRRRRRRQPLARRTRHHAHDPGDARRPLRAGARALIGARDERRLGLAGDRGASTPAGSAHLPCRARWARWDAIR